MPGVIADAGNLPAPPGVVVGGSTSLPPSPPEVTVPATRPLPLIAAAVVLAGAGALLALALTPSPAGAASPPAGAGISVAGSGTASAVPDVVRTTIGAETSAPTVDAALGGADEATRRVIDALTGRGVAERDVQTVGVQVYPQFGQDGRDVTGYTARQDLDVTLRDLDGAGATIAAAVAAGGDAARLSGISFGLADESALRSEARKAAFAAARATAAEHAALAGGRLGEVVSVREDAGGPSFARPQATSAGSSADSSVPLAPGTSEVSVTVQVRWALER